MLRTLKNFHGQKTFRLVTGSLCWSRTNGAKVASERRNVRKKLFFFKQLCISREQSDRDTKSGPLIEDFCENLTVSPLLSKSLPPGIQEKRKKLGDRSAPPQALRGHAHIA